MNKISELYRKSARGEASSEELDILDRLEGIIPQITPRPLERKENEESPAGEIPPSNEKCLPCEAHQKKRNES